MKSLNRFISNKFVLFTLGIIFVLALWFLLSLLLDRNEVVFPSPIVTFGEFFKLLGQGKTYRYLGYTFLRILMGFSLSMLLALILGLFAGNHPNLYQFLKPLMIVIKSVPTVALVFVFIVVAQPKYAPILLVFVVCFPIIYEGVVGGIQNINKDVIDSSKVDGATYFKGAFYIKLPLAIPFILVSVISSFALSFKIEIMAEVITGVTARGLGSAISSARNNDPTNTAIIFAYALLAVIIVLLVSLVEELVKWLSKRRREGKATLIEN